MKRSLLTVCTAVLLACLAAGLGGCAVDGEDTDAPQVGESRQDLSVGEAAAPGTLATDEGTESPDGERPQPQPWGVTQLTTTTGTTPSPVPGPNPAAESNSQRVASDGSAGPGGERPQPQPWYDESAHVVSLTTNKK